MRFEFDGGVLIYKRDNGYKFLFLKREEGFLDLPKGHIEEGETTEKAAVREAKEESGLDVKVDPFYRYEISYWFYFGRDRIKKKVTFFMAEVPKNARVEISKEHIGYEWLGYNDGMRLEKFKDTRELLKNAFDYITRKEELERINNEYAELPKAHADWDLSTKLVKGEGPVNAEVMIVGQAPGDTEDKNGRPFIGRSGKLLEHLLDIAGIERSRAYITSVVQFFPPKNRIPSKREISLCRNFLKRQIEVIKPKVIVLLGNVAANELIGRGNVMLHHGEEIRREGILYFVTMHPAAAVRIKKNVPVIEEDFRKLKRILDKLQGKSTD